jgi:hypothetical protein
LQLDVEFSGESGVVNRWLADRLGAPEFRQNPPVKLSDP